MASPELMSLDEIERYLQAIRLSEQHLRPDLPIDNPYNSVLRLNDVTRYIRFQTKEIFALFPNLPRIDHHLHRGKEPKRYKVIEAVARMMQEDLSKFFRKWNAGILIKARIGNEWQIIHKYEYEALAQVAAATLTPAPERRVLKMRIDMTSLGPKLRGA